ncbi:MAG: hypothetical protein BM485_02975 [Desulfobulbaceae bacterium DB1]|nr:MAG: hypothetical protein BM485_02975 [Desulfobulbaceae bacterium DB1]
MASLVIVDSEAKAKSLHDQTGGDYDVLLLRAMPMKVTHNPKEPKLYSGTVGFQFAPADDAKEFAKNLLTNLQKDIYLALDGEERGELWSWVVGKFLFAATKGRKSARRIHVSGFAEQELAASFHMVEPVDDGKAAALYIRSLFNGCLIRHINRLLGTASGPGGILLNFSFLTSLFLLEDRQAEIASFAGPAKWRINVRLSGPRGDFPAHVQEAYGITDDGFFRDAAAAKKAVALFENQPCLVKKIEETEFVIEPPMPYSLAELLHDGVTLLGMGPAAVVRSVHKFYGGAEINGRHTGLTTTPFVRSSMDHERTMARIRLEVVACYGEEELVARGVEGRVILPLLPGLAGSELPDFFSEQEKNLYELIRCRALAGQMDAARGLHLLVECGSGGCLFHGRGPILHEKGFLQVFQGGYDPNLLRESPLADLAEGRQIRVEQVIPEQASSVALEYYTFETLFDDLRDFSLPAETSMVIMMQQMLDKGYLAIDANGSFHLEENGGKVVAILNRAFPAMKGINLSAYFEQTVNEVISGRKPLDFALKQFDQNFVMHGVPLVKVQVPRTVSLQQQRSKKIIKLSGQTEAGLGEGAIEEQVPEKGSPVLSADADVCEPLPEAGEKERSDLDAQPEEEGESAAAAIIASEVLPAPESGEEMETVGGPPDETKELEPEEHESLFTAPSTEAPAVGQRVMEPVAAGEKGEKSCPACGRQLVLKSDRFGQYWACAGYPACRHSEAFAQAEEEGALLCPVCGKESVGAKRTPTGKKLYVCSAENCEFMAWSKPYAVECPGCGSPFLVEKKTASGLTVLRCPKAGCSYSQPFDSKGGNDAAGEESLPEKKKKILVRRKKASTPTGGSTKKKVVIRRVKR